MNGNAQVEEEGEIQSMSKCNFIAKILAPVFVGVMLCSTFAFAVSTDMSSNPFADVQENSPYLEGILYAVEHGITNGTAPAAFSPSATCTHAQILAFLWRAEGCPETEIENPFTNVQPDAYYYKAALWAYQKGLLNISSFDPSAPCTRLDAVTYMWKLAGSPQSYADYQDEFLFTDVSADSDSMNAITWASMDCLITNGTSATTFSPDNTCTRGQIVTFIYRGKSLFNPTNNTDDNTAADLQNTVSKYLELEYEKSLGGQFTEKRVASREETERKQQAMRDKYLVNGQFPTTADGLTYGPLDLMVDGQFPDLVMVSATKGNDGYARLEDFSPMFAKDRDSLSQQEYLARIDAYNESILNGTFTIPLYDLSGNIVGEYSSSAFYPQDESSES